MCVNDMYYIYIYTYDIYLYRYSIMQYNGISHGYLDSLNVYSLTTIPPWGFAGEPNVIAREAPASRLLHPTE